MDRARTLVPVPGSGEIWRKTSGPRGCAPVALPALTRDTLGSAMNHQNRMAGPVADRRAQTVEQCGESRLQRGGQSANLAGSTEVIGAVDW